MKSLPRLAQLAPRAVDQARYLVSALLLAASGCGTLASHQAGHLGGEQPARAVVASPRSPAKPTARSNGLSSDLATTARAQSLSQEAAGFETAEFAPPSAGYEIQQVTAIARRRLTRRGSCPPGMPGYCPPVETCPDCEAAGCEQELYPDEYLCDGGDRDDPVRYDEERMIGLETQDTVAEYVGAEGRRKVRRSNEVCVYAPRFSSVSVISGTIEDAQASRPNQSEQSLRQIALHRDDRLNVHRLDAGVERMLTRVRGSVVRNADTAWQLDLPLAMVTQTNDLVPLTYFGPLYATVLKQADEALLAVRIQSAQVWTRDQNPVIVGTVDGVQLVDSKFKVAELAGTDVRGPGRLKIVKLTDVHVASQGDEITFTIRYENPGDSPVTDVTIVDNLTPRLEYLAGSQSGTRAARFDAVDNGEGSQILRWELEAPLPPREGGEVSFKVQVR
ncbi:MAG: hypothetical protein ACK5F7_01685 [Planctomycetaceae bacterium]